LIHSPSQKITIIDSSIAGVSGDMLLGALVDAGANKAKITKLAEVIPEFLSDCKEITIDFEDDEALRKIAITSMNGHITGTTLEHLSSIVVEAAKQIAEHRGGDHTRTG